MISLLLYLLKIDYQRKLHLILLCLFALVLIGSTACENNKATASSRHIYIGFAGEQNEIWKLTRDGTQAEIIYDAPRKISPKVAKESAGISLDVIEAIRARNNNAIEFTVELQGLVVSPDHSYLTWVENYQWCPGNYCLGQSNIKILRLADNTIIVDSIHTSEIFMALTWSPDSRYLAYHEKTRPTTLKPGAFLWLLDMTTTSARIFGNNMIFDSSWSPDSQNIISNVRENSFSDVVTGLQIVSVPDNITRPVAIPAQNGFSIFRDASWSPDGKHIVFIGTSPYDPQIQSVKSALFLTDLQARETTRLTTTGEMPDFDQPVWSPNKRWIAAKAWNGDYYFDLAIIDSSTGEIPIFLSSSTIGNIYNWKWSKQGNEVLFVSQEDSSPERTQHLYIVHVPDGALVEVKLPDKIQEYLEAPQVYYGYVPAILPTW